MQQVSQYLDGERNYSKIRGDTGPLVYPAIHVYIYRILYAMTNSGTNILLAQCYFGILYIFNLGLVMACYRMAKVCFPLDTWPNAATTLLLICQVKIQSCTDARCYRCLRMSFQCSYFRNDFTASIYSDASTTASLLPFSSSQSICSKSGTGHTAPSHFPLELASR